MRNFLICACLILGCFKGYSSTISIIIKDELTKHNVYLWNEVEVKGPDTSFTYKLHYKVKEEIIVSSKGQYSFVFKSIFGHTVNKSLSVGGKKCYTLKVPELPKYYKRLPIETFLSTKTQVGDTLYIIESKALEEMQSEKIGIIKTENSNYRVLLYNGLTTEIIKEITINSATYGTVINAEDRLKKPGVELCKPDVCSFFLGKKFYTILDTDCDVKTMETIKAQVFMVESR